MTFVSPSFPCLPSTDRDGRAGGPTDIPPVSPTPATAPPIHPPPPAMEPMLMGEGPAEGPAMTVKEFCRWYRISLSVYYRLRLEHRGPVETRVRFGIRILHRSRLAWEAALLAAGDGGSGPGQAPDTAWRNSAPPAD